MQEAAYFSPSTIAEGISFLRNYPAATIFAGGTDLLVSMEYKKVKPKVILDLKGISELNYLKLEEDTLTIGAMTTIADIEENDYMRKYYPILADAASKLGAWQIRNTATIGGNLCNAAPSAELTPPLIVLNSKVTIIGPNGERKLPLEEFFLGPGKTVLKETEILKEIEIPKPSPNAIGAYGCRKWRRTMDVAIVNLAVLLELDGKVIKDARVCLGAVAPTAFRSTKTEETLIGKVLDEELITRVSEIAADDSKPITDVRASADYRKAMVKVYMKRALASIQNREV